jgi:outer membrane protein OmpA-like peptidoglycan-associated protein
MPLTAWASQRLVVMVDFGIRSPRSGALGVPRFVMSAGLLLALVGCNPIETYRHWTGISANDPNSATTPNTKNLAAGEARSYPNLATVPPPPTQALTTAELDKLTQSLIADRANAKYTSEHLQAQPEGAAAPPPPPLLPPPTPGAAQPGAPGAAPPSTASSPAGPAAAAPATAPAGSAKPAPSGPGGSAASAPSASATPAAKGARKQPPEPGPMESSLQSPQIASLPQPQQNQPAPPAPGELSMPAAPGTAKAAAAGAHLPAPPAPQPMPAAIGSAQFQPAPPPPKLAPAAPIRTATAAGKPAKPAPPPIAFTKVADIAFPGDKTNLSEADRRTLDNVLPRYRTKPGLVRVVGYAGIGASAAEQLSSYRTALDRAQAVAKGLAQAGIPATKIAVEAAPTGADAGPGRAEILFEQ